MNSEPLTAEEEGDFDRALSELRLRQFELFEASQELWLDENGRELSDDNSVAPEQQLANIVRNLQRNLIGKLTEEYTKYDEQLFLIDDQVQRLMRWGMHTRNELIGIFYGVPARKSSEWRPLVQ